MNRLTTLVAAACLAASSSALAAEPPKLAKVAVPETVAPPPVTPPAAERDGLPLVFHEDFKDADKAIAKFETIDPADWRVDKVGDRNVMSLFSRPTEKTAGNPPVRSPFGRAIVKDLYVGEFVMEVKFRSSITATTGSIKDYGHRDLCLYFGERDVSHLYYVHFGQAPDPNAGNIFVVNGVPRKNMLPVHKKPVEWTEAYHTGTVVHKADGTIETLFDGKPYLSVKDETFPVGRVGFGSFDDTGAFSEITVWGKKAEKPPAPPPVAPAEKAAPAEKKADAGK